jgi:hypothetical protein
VSIVLVGRCEEIEARGIESNSSIELYSIKLSLVMSHDIAVPIGLCFPLSFTSLRCYTVLNGYGPGI